MVIMDSMCLSRHRSTLAVSATGPVLLHSLLASAASPLQLRCRSGSQLPVVTKSIVPITEESRLYTLEISAEKCTLEFKSAIPFGYCSFQLLILVNVHLIMML